MKGTVLIYKFPIRTRYPMVYTRLGFYQHTIIAYFQPRKYSYINIIINSVIISPPLLRRYNLRTERTPPNIRVLSRCISAIGIWSNPVVPYIYWAYTTFTDVTKIENKIIIFFIYILIYFWLMIIPTLFRLWTLPERSTLYVPYQTAIPTY